MGECRNSYKMVWVEFVDGKFGKVLNDEYWKEYCGYVFYKWKGD